MLTPFDLYPPITIPALHEVETLASRLPDDILTFETPLDRCLRWVAAGGPMPSGPDILTWEHRLREYGVPCGHNVHADDWTDLMLRCMRCYGVEPR